MHVARDQPLSLNAILYSFTAEPFYFQSQNFRGTTVNIYRNLSNMLEALLWFGCILTSGATG